MVISETFVYFAVRRRWRLRRRRRRGPFGVMSCTMMLRAYPLKSPIKTISRCAPSITLPLTAHHMHLNCLTFVQHENNDYSVQHLAAEPTHNFLSPREMRAFHLSGAHGCSSYRPMSVFGCHCCVCVCAWYSIRNSSCAISHKPHQSIIVFIIKNHFHSAWPGRIKCNMIFWCASNPFGNNNKRK